MSRSNTKKNEVVGFVYKGQSSTSAREREAWVDTATTQITNSTVREKGAIPDAKTAYEVAYPILCAVYGEEAIRKELPLEVYLVDNEEWRLNGSWNYGPGVKGGVASISINKNDGRVLQVIHSK